MKFQSMTRVLALPALFLAALSLGGRPLGALGPSLLTPQGGQGNEETKDLLKKIQKEMARIDELLNRAATKSRASSRSKSSSQGSSSQGIQKGSSQEEAVKKLLKESASSNGKVIKLIDELLAKVQRDSSSSSSGSSMKPPKDSGKPSGKRRPRPDNREKTSPDLQKQKKNQGGKNPRDPKDSQEKAKLLKGNKKPPSGKTGTPNDAKGSGRWGFLPPYLQFLFRKGGAPKVPGKYRKWAEEFNRSVDRKKK